MTGFPQEGQEKFDNLAKFIYQSEENTRGVLPEF